MTRRRWMTAVAVFAAATSSVALGCTQLNPAFDGIAATESGDDAAGDGEPGDGEGDTGDGDTGDGDPGDGEPGDGDGDPGDGDGDPCVELDLEPCGEVCVDTSTDDLNCGRCGYPCPDNEDCRESVCKRPRVIFVTFGTIFGGFGGILGADNLCRAIATLHFEGKDFRAWVSTSLGGSPSDPNVGFTTDGYFVRTDGVEIAAGWEELTSGQLQNPIDHDETGAPIGLADDCSTEAQVWTGTNFAGQPQGDTCGNWILDTPPFEGSYGILHAVGPQWSLAPLQMCPPPTCEGSRHLYCVEQ